MATVVKEVISPNDAKSLPYIGLKRIQEGALHLKGIGKAEDTISTKFKFCKGDILFGKLRSYFRKVIIASFDGVCSTDIWVIRAKLGFERPPAAVPSLKNSQKKIPTSLNFLQKSHGSSLIPLKILHLGRCRGGGGLVLLQRLLK